ncbi:MAG: GDP-mannose 4,6-dehydratase [Thermoanaerobaculia bacterium]
MLFNHESPRRGETHTVREFCELAFARAGIELRWEGTGLQEHGVDAKGGRTLVEIDPRYLRPTEVELLLGDASKAKRVLGWAPRMTFRELAELMTDGDMGIAEREARVGEASSPLPGRM